jgi:protein tyrosine phosphatase (PTP) superfamily phosphohydrolase (DUF442 family)
MKRLSALSLAVLLCAACAAPTAPSTIRNFRMPLPNIDSGGQPTEAQFEALPAAGYTRVIHTRPASESGTGWEEARAAAIGIEFIRIPLASGKDLNREVVDEFARALRAPIRGRTLVACRSGNRSGALLALDAFWNGGASAEEALALGRLVGMTRAEKRVRELIAQ